MKKILILAAVLLALIIPSCRYGKSFLTHEFGPGQITRRSEISYYWQFGDLAGEGYDHHLSAASNSDDAHLLLVRDQVGNDISQINFQHRIRGINVLRDPRDQSGWFFLSVNDQRETSIYGYHYLWEEVLQRQEKSFESIARTDSLIDREDYDWNGSIHPRLLEDIDSDGKLELVCTTVDAFTVNPRGLAVYDFDSGRLKWRLDLSTCVYSILCDDFDGDGDKELVCGTIAYKNTTNELQGMNDFHSWIFVVDARGTLLHRELVNPGFGNVLLASDDLNADGTKEILAVCSAKGSAGVPNSVKWLSWTGNRFLPGKSWVLNGILEQNNDAGIYNVMDKSGRKLILLAALDSPLIALDLDLNEVQHNFHAPVSHVWGVEDLDLDGEKEVLVQTLDNRLVVLNSDLRVKAEMINPYSLEEDYRPRIVKTGEGKAPRIAIASRSEIRYYGYQHVQWGVWLKRYLQANLVSLVLILAIFSALLAIFILHRRKIFMMALDSLTQGVILTVSQDRIILVNSYLLDLLRDDQGKLPPGKLRSLSRTFPQITDLLPEFFRSKDRVYTCKLHLGREQVPHQLTLQKLQGLVTRLLIVAVPEAPDTASNSATLAWADTARRLSHNVRRHITNVILALKPLQEAGLEEGQQKHAEIIRSEIEKIRVFTHAFQRFTELKDYDLKLQDVLPSVEHCLERTSVPDGVKLIKNWDLSSVEAWIEPIRFEEALGNVINNALEAMPEGGTLHISVKKIPNHAGSTGGQNVMIEVEDSGKGIPAKYLEEIWQPFFTTKASGTGIGLPETKKIIVSMGGSVLVQSEEGSGTVVTFWLKGT